MLTSQVLGDSRGCLHEGDLAPLDALVIMPSMMSGPLASDEVKVGMRESQMTKCIHSITSSAAAINPFGRIGSMQNLNDNQIFSLDAAKSLQFIKKA